MVGLEERKAFSLVRCKSTVNTIRSFWCQGWVYTDILSGIHNTKSPALSSLLTKTIEAPKKRNRTVRIKNTQRTIRIGIKF